MPFEPLDLHARGLVECFGTDAVARGTFEDVEIRGHAALPQVFVRCLDDGVATQFLVLRYDENRRHGDLPRGLDGAVAEALHGIAPHRGVASEQHASELAGSFLGGAQGHRCTQREEWGESARAAHSWTKSSGYEVRDVFPYLVSGMPGELHMASRTSGQR